MDEQRGKWVKQGKSGRVFVPDEGSGAEPAGEGAPAPVKAKAKPSNGKPA